MQFLEPNRKKHLAPAERNSFPSPVPTQTDAGAIHWHASHTGTPVSYDRDPGVTTSRRVEVKMLKLLPLESLL